MQRIEYMNPTIDRSEWPHGLWDNEPDKIQWQDEKTGMPCLIVRNRFGALCGYVGVSHDHSLYGKSYNEVDPPVHGGLTFASKCLDGPENETICHVVEPGEDDDVWWFGFDCGHWNDLMPQMIAMNKRYGTSLSEETLAYCSYKPVPYVQREIEELAEWLVKEGGAAE